MLKNKLNLPFMFLGIFVGALGVNLLIPVTEEAGHTHSHETGSEAFHIHADFLIMVEGEKIDLSDNKYMSFAGNILDKNVHLHDNNGDVIHFHAPNVTLRSFLKSLNIILTKDCLELDGTKFCNKGDSRLELYVNGDLFEGDSMAYVPADDDSILLYYGTESETKISEYLGSIKDDACLYSGTCPERGVAPPESCGLTCEL